MPKPQIAVLNQGLVSRKLVELTGLPLVESSARFNYQLGYGPLHGALLPEVADELTACLLATESRQTTTSQTLYLQLQATEKTEGSIVVDGLQGTLGFRRHPARLLHEPLMKAVGANKNYQLHVIDATAGWGTDAFLLASFGCHMTLIEADPLVGVLLADGLRRWRGEEKQHPLPINLVRGDAVDIITKLTSADLPDVIYLDPMFPKRQKTALVKKNMAFLQQWLDKTVEPYAETLLLNTARQYTKKRVVVKRPQSAPYLANLKPNGTIATKHHRYDIYMPLQRSGSYT